MWIFTSEAFVSVVQDRGDHRRFIVRARAAGHIEALFPRATVVKMTTADYHYRATISRRWVAKAMRRQVMGIDYANFKNSVDLGAYHSALMDVWTAMRRLQDGRRYDRYSPGPGSGYTHGKHRPDELPSEGDVKTQLGLYGEPDYEASQVDTSCPCACHDDEADWSPASPHPGQDCYCEDEPTEAVMNEMDQAIEEAQAVARKRDTVSLDAFEPQTGHEGDHAMGDCAACGASVPVQELEHRDGDGHRGAGDFCRDCCEAGAAEDAGDRDAGC